MAGATRRPTRRSWCGCLRLTSVLVAYRRLLGRVTDKALPIRGLPLGTEGFGFFRRCLRRRCLRRRCLRRRCLSDAVPGGNASGDAVPGDAAPGLSPRRETHCCRSRAGLPCRAERPGTAVLCFLRRSRRRRSFARFVHARDRSLPWPHDGRISRGQSRTAILGLSGIWRRPPCRLPW